MRVSHASDEETGQGSERDMQETGRALTAFPDSMTSIDAGTAYIRRWAQDGKTVYAIHGPDGKPLAVAPTRALAFAVARQHDLEATDAH